MRNTLETLRAYAIPAVAMTALSFGAAGASAQDADVLTLDIEPQQAGPALMELASSSGVQIMLPDQAGAEVEVEGLKGEYKLEQALAALLIDTGLAYEFTSENVVLVQQSQQSEELQEVEAADDSAAREEEDEPIELEKQVVTGSRLEGGDPSARTYSYTAEEIAARGVSTLEEFFRTLPWTYSSITTQTNMSEFYQGTDQEGEYIELGLGISTVNLRNMGSANTLVLVNGRRIAGTGEEDDFANILTIPLSAIERVDIQLDGASAVYGSDAIGGVVNFITKRTIRAFRSITGTSSAPPTRTRPRPALRAATPGQRQRHRHPVARHVRSDHQQQDRFYHLGSPPLVGARVRLAQYHNRSARRGMRILAGVCFSAGHHKVQAENSHVSAAGKSQRRRRDG